MNSSPASPCPDRSFSLVEMMVAITVLALLVSLLGKIMLFSAATWSNGKRRADNFTKAQAILDVMSRDYRLGVYRADLPAFSVGGTGAGSFTNAFYSRSQSGGSSTRALSLVAYQVATSATNSVLQRMTAPVGWTAAVPFGQPAIPASAFTSAQDVVDGVLRAAVTFVRPDGVLTNGYAPGMQAVGIGLVVVDDVTLASLAATRKLPRLLGDAALSLPASLSVTNSPGRVWQANFDHTPGAPAPLDYDAYPNELRTGLRCFERYVPLP